MGKRGYSGNLISKVYRFSNNKDQYYLVNSSNRWMFASDKEFEKYAQQILEEASEDDQYELWYHVDLL